MKRFLIFFLLILSMHYAGSASAQGWAWAKGCTGGCEGYGIAVDPWGNVYASGFAGAKLTFPGAVLTDFGICGTVAVKYDGNGNFLWARGTQNGFAKPINLACDVQGNLYVYGYYLSEQLTIDGITLHNPDSTSMLFLIKFAPSGTVLWAENLFHGELPGNILVSGNVLYLTAAYYDATVITGAFTLHNANASGLTSDIALLKIDSGGHVRQATGYGSSGNEVAYVAVTPRGNVYLAGTSTSPGFTIDSFTLVNTDSSLFIARFDSSLRLRWAKNETGIGKVGSWVSGVATDSAENAFVCGSWRPAAYFGTQVLLPDTTCNVYLEKFDSSGNIGWVKEVTGNGQLGGNGVLTDYCGNVWLIGGMGDQTPGHHGSNYIKIDTIRIDTPSESRDPMFISEWTTAGTYVQTAVLPTGGDDESNIGTDALGNIYVSTDYWLGPYHIAGNTLFDPVQPSEDLFILKFVAGPVDTTVKKKLVCITDSTVLAAPAGYVFYRWDNGSTGTALPVRSPGTYKLYCTGKCGSGIELDIFTVAIGKADTVYNHIDTVACLHAQSVLYAPAGYDPYLWSTGDTARADTISAPGMYWVIASGTCTVPAVIDTFAVRDTSLDLAFSLGNDTAVCAPLVLEAPLPGYHYLWQDGSTGSTDVATQSGTYTLTVSDLSCFHTDSVVVSFPDLAQHLQDTVLCQEHLVRLLLNANVPPGASAMWSTGSDADSIWIYTPGTYWITVTQDACSGSDTMTLSTMICDCEALFPAAFTPNGDGRNDTYGPILDRRCNVFDYSFCIYNRWGNLVFTSHNRDEKWDATYRDIPAETGTYMYQLQYCSGSIYNKHSYKGDVLLVR